MNITSFKGLNNVTDPLRLGMEWLAQADDVNITNTGAISKRDGYSRHAAGNYTSAYATLDFQRMYTVSDSQLKDFSGNVLASLTSSAPVFWCEVNDQVFFNNGVDSGVIMPDGAVLPWRREITINRFIGADGSELAALLDPLPLGTDVIQHWRGRIYAAQYMPSEAQTVVWFSMPLGFHMFSLDSDFIILPGRVTMLAPHDDALVVGTNQRVFAYTGDKLDELAQYGVVPGQHWAKDDQRILFWTERGLCAALPFTNLTERQVSVAPGVRAGGTVVRSGGQKRYVVALEMGGSAFNSSIY